MPDEKSTIDAKIRAHLAAMKRGEQARLAKEIGLSTQHLSGVRRGRVGIDVKHWPAVAEFFGENVADWFRLAREESDLLRHTQAQQSEAEPDPDFDVTEGYLPDDLPIITEGEASPHGRIFWDEGGLLNSITDRISRPAGVKDRNAYGVRVTGTSMLPVYRQGQCVVVSPSTPVDDGDRVYVELHSGEHLIKIARRMAGGWILESANPGHAPRVVKNAEIKSMHAVVWTREKLPGVRVVDETGRRR